MGDYWWLLPLGDFNSQSCPYQASDNLSITVSGFPIPALAPVEVYALGFLFRKLKNCWSWKACETYTEVKNSCYDKICRFWHHFPHPVLGSSSVHIFIQSCRAAVSKTSTCVFICASNSRGHMSSSPNCSLTMFCSFPQEQWLPNLIYSTTSNKCLCYCKREKAWLLFLKPFKGFVEVKLHPFHQLLFQTFVF